MFTAPVEDVQNRRKELRSSTRTTTTFYQFLPMLSKRITLAGAKHGPSERQRMHCKATEMLQKARQPKHGGHKSILERWLTLLNVTRLPWRIIHTAQQDLKEF